MNQNTLRKTLGENISRFVNQDEYEVLENIEHLRMNGWSYGRIANYLNSRNVLSKQGGKWYSSSVRSVLGNGVLRKS